MPEVVVAIAIQILVLGITAKLNKKKPVTERGDERSPTNSWDGISTARGSGFLVPIPYGEVPLGGVEIGSSISRKFGVDVLDVLLLLGWGPIEEIAGLQFNRFGQIDDTGNLGSPFGGSPTSLWTGIRANGNEVGSNEAIVSARAGLVYQAALRQFQDTRSTIDVGAELTDVGSFTATVTNAALDRVELSLNFPSGLYDSRTGSPQPTTLDIRVRWRKQGGAWSAWQNESLTQNPANSNSVRFFVEVPFSSAVEGPYEVQLERLTAPVFGVQDRLVWDSLVVVVDGIFEYPGQAVMALSVRATEKLQGSTPDFRISGKWRKLRAWVDTETGWLEPTYAAAGPWTFSIGNNPAAVFTDLATSQFGAIRAFKVDKLDLQRFRDWMDFCDQDDGDGAPLCRFDHVIDQSRSAWDWLRDIAAAGRARPVILGDTLSVVYEWADAHGRGSNSVPARATTTLITAGQVEAFTLTYKSPNDPPNFYDVEILDRDNDYARTILPVEDQELSARTRADLVTPIGNRREGLQMTGVVRRRQAKREAHIQHQRNRLSVRNLQLTAGIDQVALQVGDVFEFQHDGVAFGGEQSWASRTLNSGMDVTSIVLDRDVTIGPSSAMVVVNNQGLAEEVTLVTSGAVAAGSPISISGTISIVKGAPVAFGTTAVLTKKFVVVDRAMEADLKQRISAEEWTEEIYDVPAALLEDDNSEQPAPSEATAPSIVIAPAGQVAVAAAAGVASVGFDLPSGSARRRVYAREKGMRSWTSMGEGAAEPQELRGLRPHREYEVAVAVQDKNGVFQSADSAESFTFTAQEFLGVPPAAPADLRTQADDVGAWLTWDPVPADALSHYEIRRGPHWFGAQKVGETTDAEWHIRDLPNAGTQRYMIAAVARGGIRSGIVGVDVPGHPPADQVIDLTSVDPTGTSVGVELDVVAGALVMTEEWFKGTHETGELDAGSVARRFWSIHVDIWAQDREMLLSEATFAVGSGEAAMRTLLGRDASTHSPGDHFGNTVAMADQRVRDARGLVSGAELGPGAHTSVLVEVQFDETGTGSWTDWEPYRARYMTARKIKVRLTFQRQSNRWQIYAALGFRVDASQ